MLRIEIDADDAGQRLRIRDRLGQELLQMEYDAASHRLFVWATSKAGDVGPEITIHNVNKEG